MKQVTNEEQNEVHPLMSQFVTLKDGLWSTQVIYFKTIILTRTGL